MKLRCPFIVIEDGVGIGGEHSASTLHATATKKSNLNQKDKNQTNIKTKKLEVKKQASKKTKNKKMYIQ